VKKYLLKHNRIFCIFCNLLALLFLLLFCLGCYFIAPDNKDDIFFVTNCCEDHTHSKIAILDRVLNAVKGFLHVPGVIRSVTTLRDKICLLFSEYQHLQWILPGRDQEKTGNVIHAVATEEHFCPFKELEVPCMFRQLGGNERWRIASFDGSTVTNLTDNRQLKLSVFILLTGA
jgi:hypothetical protein